jgi:hypothetical protein
VSRFAVLALVLSSVVASETLPRRTDRVVRKIGAMRLLYAGLTADLDPTNPVVPKNTPAGVRVSVRAGDQELSETEASRLLGGAFLIKGELSGPGLRGAQTLQGDPSSFVLPLPALEISGNYSFPFS